MAGRLVGDFPLNNKIVVITGGGSGIGLALSQACHAKGAKVLIGDLQLRSEAKEFIDKAKDGSVVFTKCDVTNWKDLKNLVDVSVEKFGEVPDVYCPVAGIFEPKSSNFWDDEEDESYATIRINSEHPIKLTRIAFKALLGANKKGVVALVASGAGLIGIYLSALYCASKHAVVGLARSLGPADEQEGIKVVCMCPGLVNSPMVAERTDSKGEMLGYHGSEETSRPYLRPADIAESMVRLIEDKKYPGGTIMSRRPAPLGDQAGGESIVDEGVTVNYDTEGTFVKDILAKERGVAWK